ncbi:hypothetical protein ACFQZS_13050 [Mucilaginibacter calamicampi]|uniref:Uncharacterized protein n=1 Tax=Mucilaginibacter calamicampi TaxID=1302352 RepID=A0ABW2YX55_9SPHI
MRSKITLSTTLTTLSVIVLVLAALTFMDNNTDRNTYAGIVMLCCLFLFVIALSLRSPTGKPNRSM